MHITVTQANIDGFKQRLIRGAAQEPLLPDRPRHRAALGAEGVGGRPAVGIRVEPSPRWVQPTARGGGVGSGA